MRFRRRARARGVAPRRAAERRAREGERAGVDDEASRSVDVDLAAEGDGMVLDERLVGPSALGPFCELLQHTGGNG